MKPDLVDEDKDIGSTNLDRKTDVVVEELTVEEALAELREITPHYCEIRYSTTGRVRLTVFSNRTDPNRRSWQSLEILCVERDTLSEAMAQVRKWKESQS